MASDFDELVERLLHDVALSGSHGFGPDDLSKAVKAYYGSSGVRHAQEESSQGDLLFSDAPPLDQTAVDDALIDAVWNWLAEHPDVEIRTIPDSDTNQDRAEHPHPQPQASNDHAPSGSSSAAKSKRASKRIFTGEERMWHAITGHGVDKKRVPEKEFECLSVIAAHGPAGVVQPAVTRITGQDKRSVPKRTDMLAQKGYITKNTVVAGGATTSLLKLKRYADQGQDRADSTPSIHGLRIIDVEAWYNKTIDLLKRQPQQIIAVQDLRIELGIHTKDKTKETHELMRCIRRLTDCGCMRKCSAMSQIHTGEITSTKSVRCIQLMREPTARDKLTWTKNESKKIKRPAAKRNATRNPVGPAETSTEKEVNEEIDLGEEDDDDLAELDQNENRNVPQWTPHIPHVNLLFDEIDRAGPDGISSMELSERTTGPLWRRPFDEVMAKLTDIWQHSQPPHLRHLGIVRDTGVRNKFTHYQYRTYENFEKAVAEGKVTWEAVKENNKAHASHSRKGKKKEKAAVSESPAPADLDDWGFPKYDPKLFAGPEGRASLAECSAVTVSARPGGVAAGAGYVKRGKGRRGRPPKAGATPTTSRKRTLPDANEEEIGKTLETFGSQDAQDVEADQPVPAEASHVPVPVKRSRATIEKHDKAFQDWVEATANRLVRAELNAAQTSEVEPAFKKRRVSNEGPTDTAGTAAPPLPEDRVAQIKDMLLNQSRSGIYINTPAAMALKAESYIQLGRPRKALIAVVKTDRLKGLEWFKQEPTKMAPAATGKRTKTIRKIRLDQSTTAVPSEKAPVQQGVATTQQSSAQQDGMARLPDHQSPPHEQATIMPSRQEPAAEVTDTPHAADPALSNLGQSYHPPYTPLHAKATAAVASADATPSHVTPLAIFRPYIASSNTNMVPSSTSAEVATHSESARDGIMPVPGPKEPPVSTTLSAVSNPGAMEVDGPAQLFPNPQQRVLQRTVAPLHYTANNQAINHLDQEAVTMAEADLTPTDTQTAEQEDTTESGEAKKKGISSKVRKNGTRREGGNVSHQRTKIIFDVMKQCSGVYPGGREMWYPFATAWNKLFNQLPDRQTADRAVKNLVDSGKLKKITFAFQDKKGLNVEGKLLLLPDVNQTSSRVQEVKQAMIAAYPLQHIPGEAEVSEQIGSKAKMVTRPDMGRNRSLPAGAPKDAYPKPRYYTQGVDFPMVEGLLVQRTAAATEMADDQPRILGFRDFRLARKAEKRRLTNGRAAEDSDTSDGEYGAPTSRANRINVKGGLTRNMRLNDTSAVIRQPLRSLQVIKKPSGLGYLPSQAAHSVLNPGYMTVVEETRPVERKKPGPKPKFPKAAAAKLVQGASALLMARQQAIHAPSGTFGTDVFEVPFASTQTTSPYASTRPKRKGRQDSTIDAPTEAPWNKEQRMPETLSHILARAELLGHAAASREESAKYKFDREVDRVEAWEEDIVNNRCILVDQQGWTFINHGLNQPHILPDRDTPDQDFTEDVESAAASAIPDTAPLRDVQQNENHVASSVSQTPSAGQALEIHQYQPSVPTSTSLTRPAVLSPQSLEPLFDKAYVTEHKEEVFHHVGHGRYKRGPKPNKRASVQLQVVPYEIPSPRSVQSPAAVSPAPQDTEIAPKKKYKSRKRKASSAEVDEDAYNDGDFTPQPDPKRRKYFGRDRVTSAVFVESELSDILVRALALVGLLCGGIDRSRFSWDIVAHAMNFQYEGEFLRRRWQRLVKKRDVDVRQLQDAMREPFLRAYENSELPTIDYANLASTDWPALMNWVETTFQPKVDSKVGKLHDLPGSMEALRAKFDVVEPAELRGPEHNDFFTSLTDAYLRDTAQRFIHGNVLTGEERPSNIGKDDLVLLKSWCRAVTTTKAENYDDAAAAGKLKLFPGQLVQKAIDQMLEAQILTQAKKGRQLPGRNYHLSSAFLKLFERWPSPDVTYLRDVASAWQSITARLEESDTLQLTMHTKDPEMVVFTNLVAQGHLKVISVLPERNDDFDAPFPKLTAWGYTDINYNAKWVDKARLRFPIVYEKTATWTTQHNLKQVPIPVQPDPVPGESELRIPFWIDIHNNFIAEMWEMMLRSLLHLVVFRPGTTAKAMERTHKGKIWLWEIEMMMKWMEETGLVERIGRGEEEDGMWKGGWRAADWWYCAFLPEIATW